MEDEQKQKLIDATIESVKEKIKQSIDEIEAARKELGIEPKVLSPYNSWHGSVYEYDGTFLALQGLVSDLAETMGDPISEWESSAC